VQGQLGLRTSPVRLLAFVHCCFPELRVTGSEARRRSQEPLRRRHRQFRAKLRIPTTVRIRHIVPSRLRIHTTAAILPALKVCPSRAVDRDARALSSSMGV